jgi:uncharacterized membrane protein YeaQ/YmgE (transglycosylase-associated protein family)
MGAVGYVLLLILNGLLVGALARLLVPGPDPMSIVQTTLVGIVGSLIAGLITYYAFEEARAWGFLIALLWAVAIVFAIRKFRERQLGPEAHRRPASGTAFGGSPGMGGGATVRFMPGCLVGSLVASLLLTLFLNLLLRAF